MRTIIRRALLGFSIAIAAIGLFVSLTLPTEIRPSRCPSAVPCDPDVSDVTDSRLLERALLLGGSLVIAAGMVVLAGRIDRPAVR